MPGVSTLSIHPRPPVFPASARDPRTMVKPSTLTTLQPPASTPKINRWPTRGDDASASKSDEDNSTNATCLYKAVGPQAEKTIHYYDYTSLYPWLNKCCHYRLGHPVIYCSPEGTDLSPYFGLAKVTILPLRGLFHPVQPFTHASKLTFPLCRACALANVDKALMYKIYKCDHPEHERCLTGTCCTPELEKAVDKGYLIRHLHEVSDVPASKVGLFKYYVDTWLKLKVEASGWPPGCDTEDERQDFLARFHAHEGIQLEYENIAKTTWHARSGQIDVKQHVRQIRTGP